jgi:hypothetical protein
MGRTNTDEEPDGDPDVSEATGYLELGALPSDDKMIQEPHTGTADTEGTSFSED